MHIKWLDHLAKIYCLKPDLPIFLQHLITILKLVTFS